MNGLRYSELVGDGASIDEAETNASQTRRATAQVYVSTGGLNHLFLGDEKRTCVTVDRLVRSTLSRLVDRIAPAHALASYASKDACEESPDVAATHCALVAGVLKKRPECVDNRSLPWE